MIREKEKILFEVTMIIIMLSFIFPVIGEMICFGVILVFALKYYIECIKPIIRIEIEYYFLCVLRQNRNKMYFTESDKRKINQETMYIIKLGRRLRKELILIIQNPSITFERRERMKNIIEEVKGVLKTERLL